MTLEQALEEGIKDLSGVSVPNAAIDAWYLLEEVTKINRAQFFLKKEQEMTAKDYERYRTCIRERMSRLPLQYITGSQEFMGLSFYVNRDVLIPRQDTEILVEEALKKMEEKKSVLDMCTGSGCIITSLAVYGKPYRAVAVDISAKALRTARKNAERNHAGTIEFIESDLFERVEGKYDIIISNPPYIKTEELCGLMEEVRLFEPRLALDGKEDGLFFYRKIIKESVNYLNQGGYLFFEIGCEQAEAVSRLFREQGFSKVEVVKDLAGLDRVVYGRWMEQGGK